MSTTTSIGIFVYNTIERQTWIYTGKEMVEGSTDLYIFDTFLCFILLYHVYTQSNSECIHTHISAFIMWNKSGIRMLESCWLSAGCLHWTHCAYLYVHTHSAQTDVTVENMYGEREHERARKREREAPKLIFVFWYILRLLCVLKQRRGGAVTKLDWMNSANERSDSAINFMYHQYIYTYI